MDSRTLENIATLHPKAQPWAVAFMEAVESSGILPAGWAAKIISGHRTWAEQNELYAIGRTKEKNRKKVTDARGGQSNHNFGIAWDIGIFDAKGKYLRESPYYAKLGPVGIKIGLKWGGKWKTFTDRPHYEVPVGLTLAQLREKTLAGVEIPVPTYQPSGGGTPSPEIPPAAGPKTIRILENGADAKVPAYFEDGRVWVAIRAFTEVFGGHVVSAKASEKKFEVMLNGSSATLTGVIVNGVGYVRFADINRVLEWGYQFTGSALDIMTE